MEAFAAEVAAYLIRVVVATIAQILILLGPCLLLSVVMSIVAGTVQRQAYGCLGRSLYLGLFGWLGTAVHEIGHAIFLLLFGHQITEIKLFAPDPVMGTLGYVKARYNPASLYQRIGMFFASIGPILFGTLVIYVAYRLLVQPTLPAESYRPVFGDERYAVATIVSDIARSAGAILASLVAAEHLLRWQFYLFVYISFAVGSSIQLSPPDIEGAIAGFKTFATCLLLFNLGTLWLGDVVTGYAFFVSQWYGFFYAMMAFALTLNLVAAALLYVLGGLIRVR